METPNYEILNYRENVGLSLNLRKSRNSLIGIERIMDRRILEKLEGCFYTIFTPFDKFGQIDFETLEKYIEKLYAGGAEFYVMAYNSRYSQLSNEEIFTLNEFCCRTVKSLSPDNVIIVGDPIHCDTKTSIEYSRHARDCGADLISLLFREKFFCEDQV